MSKFVFFLFLILILFPKSVFAHAVGQPPFLQVDGKYAGYYDVPLSSLSIDLPQDQSPQNYVLGQPVNLNIDTTALQLPQNVVDGTNFAWDFGDQTTGHGTKFAHIYKNPGTYVVSITASYQNDEPQLIESCIVNILPSADYQPPKAIIFGNGQQISDPINHPLKANFQNLVNFDATKSSGSSPIVKYIWDFGDSATSSSQLVDHQYPKDMQVTYPILRVVDSLGFYSDSYIEIQSDVNAVPYMTPIPVSNKLKTQVTPISSNFINSAYYKVNILSKNLVSQLLTGPKSLPFIATVVLFVFIAGGLHALTPGHGKAVLAAFLLGQNKGRIKDVFILAASLTLTHTLLIFILGFVFLVLDKNHTLTTVMPFFTKFGAVVVVLLSFTLIKKGLDNIRHHHDHAHGHDHSHPHQDHHHDHPTSKSLLWAGFSGGVVPCTDAFALLLLTASAGHVALGLLLVAIFSLGLSVTVISLGLVLVTGKNTLHLDEKLGQIGESYLPIMSGIFLFVISLGLLLA